MRRHKTIIIAVIGALISAAVTLLILSTFKKDGPDTPPPMTETSPSLVDQAKLKTDAAEKETDPKKSSTLYYEAADLYKKAGDEQASSTARQNADNVLLLPSLEEPATPPVSTMSQP